MIARKKKVVALATLGVTTALALSACGGSDSGASGSAGGSDSGSGASVSGSLAGAGASTQESAQGALTQSFIAQNSGAQVTYQSVGSGKGVEQFLDGGVQFAGTDKALTQDEITKAADGACTGGTAFDIPAYVSPIALVYNLEGVDDLQLSGPTVAGIFSGRITTWNDPKIAADNKGAKLPDEKIVPVHRSDKSGTTNNFTDYLHAVAPDEWTHEAAEIWPDGGGQSGEKTSGLLSTVEGGTGTIGYADAGQAQGKQIAKLKVGDEYVAPEPEAAAKAVDASPREKGRDDKDIVVQLDRKTTESGAYPMVLVSYLAMCDTYKDAGQADLMKAYANYVVSSEGQQTSASAAKSAPLSDALSADAKTSIDSIKAAG